MSVSVIKSMFEGEMVCHDKTFLEGKIKEAD